jgi:hypothetical protein
MSEERSVQQVRPAWPRSAWEYKHRLHMRERASQRKPFEYGTQESTACPMGDCRCALWHRGHPRGSQCIDCAIDAGLPSGALRTPGGA